MCFLKVIDKCSKFIWAIDRHFHHSIEPYEDDSIIAPIIIDQSIKKAYPILNHGYAIVDIKQGKIIK